MHSDFRIISGENLLSLGDPLKHIDLSFIDSQSLSVPWSPKDLEFFLDHLYQAKAMADFAPNGLQISGDRPIRNLAIAVSASAKVLRQAIAWGADALIVHHGLFWSNQSQILVGHKRSRIKSILDAGISLLAYHLPMDGHPVLGNAAQLALALDLRHCINFGSYKNVNLGVRGRWSSPLSLSQAQESLELILDRNIQIFGQGKEVIQNVAIVTGGGQSELLTAARSGDIELFISGEISERNVYEADEEQIWFAVAGHYSTETFGPKALAAFMSQLLVFDQVAYIDCYNPI